MKKPKDGWSLYIRNMASINGQVAFPEIKVKKKRKFLGRKKSDKPRRHDEKDLELRIIRWLRIHGAECGRVKTMGRQLNGVWIKDPYLFIGVPDLLCFHKNKLWFIECKTEIGILSDDQKKFQELCIASGINHIVARKLDDVLVILNS